MSTPWWQRNRKRSLLLSMLFLLTAAALGTAPTDAKSSDKTPDPVLEWNQVFIDTLIATNTPNSSSQRLGAIVHTAIFDALNGIERRYTPIFVHERAPRGASRRAAVVSAAYTALVSLFPTRTVQLTEKYDAALAALVDDGGDGGQSLQRGIEWGTHVAGAVHAWRLNDGFAVPQSPFFGGTAVGQWRMTSNCNQLVGMTAQSLAFTDMFVLDTNRQFQPPPPRAISGDTDTYVTDFNAVKALGRATGSSRTADQTALAPFWEGNASVHWNQAANQIALANHLSMSDSNRLLAVLNLAMADTAFTIWRAKRDYGERSTEVTWRPWTAILLADTDGNGATLADPLWAPLVATPCHPEYPAGHPGQNGAAATVLLSHFADAQTFTLTTRFVVNGQPVDVPRTYTSISQARTDGNDARAWGGMHYPSTIAVSDVVGAEVAEYVNANAMRRRPSHFSVFSSQFSVLSSRFAFSVRSSQFEVLSSKFPR